MTAKNGNYEQNMKNRCKICIFGFSRLKLGLNDEKLNYLSDPAYKKLISQKTKKLARFFDSQAPPRSFSAFRGGVRIFKIGITFFFVNEKKNPLGDFAYVPMGEFLPEHLYPYIITTELGRFFIFSNRPHICSKSPYSPCTGKFP